MGYLTKNMETAGHSRRRNEKAASISGNGFSEK
jgi:hypothetical protein